MWRVQISNLTTSGFLWDDQNQWSKITHIMEQQMNLRIISRVDLLVPLMCCDLSDLKSLIPIHIIHMECTLCSNRPSHCFFPTFGMDKSGKICQLYWKALLWICKIAKFESEIFAALGSYIVAHVRRITFKLGNFTQFKALHNWSMLKVQKTVEESILPLEL